MSKAANTHGFACPIAVGEFIPAHSGTRIMLHLRMPILALAVVATWFGLGLCMLVWVAKKLVLSWTFDETLLPELILMSAGLATGAGFFLLGQMIVHSDGAFLRHFLQETLEAEELPQPTGQPT